MKIFIAFSFFLNHLFNKSRLFEVGDTVNPKTKGIWMWIAPRGITSGGARVVVLDTEGFYSDVV